MVMQEAHGVLAGKSEQQPNKGMKLTRSGAGAERSRRGEAFFRVAAQLMPGVLRTIAGAGQQGWER